MKQMKGVGMSMKKKIFKAFLILILFAESAYAVSGYPQKVTAKNLTLTDANTEYQMVLPESTAGFTMQSRTAADFKWGNASASGTVYYTVKSGTVYSTPVPLNLGMGTPNTTLFLQSGNAAQVIEVLYWN